MTTPEVAQFSSAQSFAEERGRTIASGSHDATVHLWDVATASSFRTFEGRTKSVLNVAFSPDGETLASGSDDGSLRLLPSSLLADRRPRSNAPTHAARTIDRR